MIGIGVLVLLLLILWAGASFYVDWLWFESLAFSPVFWTMLLSKTGIASVSWLVFIAVVVVNLLIAHRIQPFEAATTAPPYSDGTTAKRPFAMNSIDLFVAFLLLLISFTLASRSVYRWDMILLYFNQESFGSTDPIFNRDIGYYFYSLPYYRFIEKGLLSIFVIAGLATAWWYLKSVIVKIIEELSQTQGKGFTYPKISLAPKVRLHLMVLVSIVLILFAWDFYLKIFDLLYSTVGSAYGAGYTDVNVRVLCYRIIAVASIAFAVILFINGFRFRKKLAFFSGIIWFAIVLLLGNVYPVMVQQFSVKPNELKKESPYIAHNINFTRRAYNLDKIQEVPFAGDDQLSQADLDKHADTVQNIRIWDERPLLQTYRQIQTIRLYYDFHNVDVDRYLIDDKYRQVMLAARELVVDRLPPQANTWVNRHLIYTHGYGVAASPVNEVTKEGLPQLFIKDLPPAFTTDLKIARPEIYYGEKTQDYVLVKTKTEEFDYPKGDKNVYTNYQGSGGIPVNSFFRRLLFAIKFVDPQILFTNYLSADSRIMYNRRIETRTRAIAPFLDYDADPYLVVSNDRLFWIQDAYTTSNMYPYSRRSYRHLGNKPLNYIRNSVKIVMDAYSGDVSFYSSDAQDPLVKAYANVFPDLFKPFDTMPADLKRHIRYPKDLFKIQVDIYKTYHMQDVQVFYNQEDLWGIPDELYGDSRQEMQPYYIILKLPDEEKAEFLLMLPFTPSNKDNMIGWLAARSDFPGYGKLLVYKLPKEKLVYGPMQIEARVDQQTSISRELSLWGQRGSRVIRGNLLAIPMAGAFVYVEPVYLEAKQEEEVSSRPQANRQPSGGLRKKQPQQAMATDISRAASLPELKRVIVGIGNRVVMEENLDKALLMALDSAGVSPAAIAGFIGDTPGSDAKTGAGDTGQAILRQYEKAKSHMRQGDWAAYGKAMETLEEMLTDQFGEQ